MRLFLFLLFPFVEVYLFIQVGDNFGYLAAFAGLILAFVAGANLLRFTKARSAQNLVDAFASAQTSQTAPAAAMGTVMAQMAAAVLLMIPGYLSDLLALLILFPLTRSLLMLVLIKRVMKSGSMKFGFGPSRPGQKTLLAIRLISNPKATCSKARRQRLNPKIRRSKRRIER